VIEGDELELVRVRMLVDLADVGGDDRLGVPDRSGVNLLGFESRGRRQAIEADSANLQTGERESFDEVRERDVGQVHVVGEPLERNFHRHGPDNKLVRVKGRFYGRGRFGGGDTDGWEMKRGGGKSPAPKSIHEQGSIEVGIRPGGTIRDTAKVAENVPIDTLSNRSHAPIAEREEYLTRV